MSGLELEDINVWLNGQKILHDVNISIAKGECVALLGPSGCGKTTTLRTIAGFIHPQAGDVRISGQSCVDLPPNRRNVGLVFQDYALFPHMTVAQNVGYGLRMRKRSDSESEKLVHQFLEMVQLDHVKDRMPQSLSGGQRQRVALARALAKGRRHRRADRAASRPDAVHGRRNRRAGLRQGDQHTGVG